MIAQTLQGREPRDRNGRRLLEGHARWFQGDTALLANRHVFGERSAFRPVDFVTGSKLPDVPTDCLDHPCEIHAHPRVLWSTEPASDTGDAQAGDAVPVQDVQGSRMDTDQHLVVRGGRFVDFLELEDIR